MAQRREVPKTDSDELEAMVRIENALYGVLFEDRQWQVLTNGEKKALTQIHNRIEQRGNEKREAIYG